MNDAAKAKRDLDIKQRAEVSPCEGKEHSLQLHLRRRRLDEFVSNPRGDAESPGAAQELTCRGPFKIIHPS